MEAELQKAVRALGRRDPVIRGLARTHGLPRFRPHDDYFGTLVESIVSQQISSRAAATVYGKLQAAIGGVWDPRLLLELPEETLRGVGLSGQKVGYLRSLAGLVASGELDLAHLASHSDEEIVRELTRVKGIGVWTAQMFLIFSLARLDVLPVADLGVQKGMQFAYDLSELPTPSKVSEIADERGWAPYRSVASWYMWRVVAP